MKLHADAIDASHVISAYTAHTVTVDGIVHRQSLVVAARGPVQAWHARSVEQLTAEHFEQLAGLDPELVVFGSGQRLCFVHPSLHASLMSRGIGVETMDTAAACRTYNILAAEGRRVVAALILPGQDADAP